ncbi:MAG: two-component sensor histidine kinase [Candidatus Sungbacteria bacterium]|uniref:histidine kinase n=1 Tax=Candidatus Sungiibacteriota bacterium TaxID=2750080 RepID=A0A932QXS2_9BACT|nr:two-component sensor histidine kinase [Candidatus Sungbacteria bacterium]
MSIDGDLATHRDHLYKQMLTAISHDLKTPLATVIGSLEIYRRMENALTKEKRDGLIHSALMEAYRLDGFITNILDITRLESGMIRVRPETCDLGTLINDCIIQLGPRRNGCKIALQSTGSDLVRADPVLFSRALKLVLENAVKFGGSNPEIQVAYGNDVDGVRVCISDRGPGLPPGKEEEVFSKYTRYAKADQQSAGYGLGLAICRQLMTAQGGTVKAENIATGGAAFTFHLPVAC